MPYAIAGTILRLWRAYVRQVMEVNVTTANKCAPSKDRIAVLLLLNGAWQALP